ncbi:hypothetical protein ElyMa_001807100 [Elysia marginata]|uniref:Secreted protein n=1 Tax=Elysia marginata TaxID=1093978 RepID=A0AAV4EGR8_9GAST|nr:hypothetical protein ElyMa_001807100 [Elysia marginata]
MIQCRRKVIKMFQFALKFAMDVGCELCYLRFYAISQLTTCTRLTTMELPRTLTVKWNQAMIIHATRAWSQWIDVPYLISARDAAEGGLSLGQRTAVL